MPPLTGNSIAWRGLVVNGEVWAWPMVLLDHAQAMETISLLRKYTARWRQWSPGTAPDFDPGVSAEDKALVETWLVSIGAL